MYKTLFKYEFHVLKIKRLNDSVFICFDYLLYFSEVFEQKDSDLEVITWLQLRSLSD